MTTDGRGDLMVSARLRIPAAEFAWSFARSGGPGGQNVNKVNSKAILRWAVMTSPSLSDDVRQRFLSAYASRLTTEGELVLASDEHRDQPQNIAACYEKLAAMLQAVLVPPKKRKPTKPSAGSKRRRLEAKQRQSVKKESRRAPRE